MKPIIKSPIIFATVLCSLAATACTPIVANHGFINNEEGVVTAQIGSDNKTSILSKYGNPTQTGTFDEQVWYYISATQNQKAFFKPRTTERQITAIGFDDNDGVTDVRKYTLADGRVVNYSKDKTPTRGREVTFIEQLFGSVGRSPITLPGSDPNLPTAAGGPRTQ